MRLRQKVNGIYLQDCSDISSSSLLLNEKSISLRNLQKSQVGGYARINVKWATSFFRKRSHPTYTFHITLHRHKVHTSIYSVSQVHTLSHSLVLVGCCQIHPSKHLVPSHPAYIHTHYRRKASRSPTTSHIKTTLHQSLLRSHWQNWLKGTEPAYQASIITYPIKEICQQSQLLNNLDFKHEMIS